MIELMTVIIKFEIIFRFCVGAVSKYYIGVYLYATLPTASGNCGDGK